MHSRKTSKPLKIIQKRDVTGIVETVLQKRYVFTVYNISA